MSSYCASQSCNLHENFWVGFTWNNLCHAFADNLSHAAKLYMRYLNWPFKIFLCVIEILTWSFRASVKHHSITPFALSLWIRCQQLSTEYTIIKVWYTSRWVIMNEAIVRKSIVNRLARVTCIAWCVKNSSYKDVFCFRNKALSIQPKIRKISKRGQMVGNT